MTSIGFALAAALFTASGISIPLKDRITVATFYSPHRDAISSESWVSYAIGRGYSLGFAYVWESRRVRPVSSVRFIEQMAWHPGLTMKTGFRSAANGLVTDSLTIHQRFGDLQVEGGIGMSGGFARGVASTSLSLRHGFAVGLQADGRNVVTFLSYSKNGPILAGYLVDWKHPAYMIGWRF